MIATGQKRILAGVVSACAVMLLSGCGGSDTSEESATVNSEAAPVTPEYVIPTGESETPAQDLISQDVDTTGWQIQPPFYGAGREPFWRLELNGGWFVFQRLGLAEIEIPAIAPETLDGADIFHSEVITIEMKPGVCPSAQDNEQVVGALNVTYDEVVYSGCVYSGETAQVGVDGISPGDSKSSWKTDLAIFAYEIDTCLNALEGVKEGASNKALISATDTLKDGSTAFVLDAANGQLYDCAAFPNGEVGYIKAVSRNDVAERISSKNGRFYRVESGAPPRSCLEAEAIMQDNQLIGYLLPGRCRP